MKKLLAIFLNLFICGVVHSATCAEDMSLQLTQTLTDYSNFALVKDAKTMEPYFNFPLRLNGPYHGDKPTLISKKFFLKNYSLIFIKNKVTKNTEFFNNFKKSNFYKTTADELQLFQEFCDGQWGSVKYAQRGNLVFQWFPKLGWKIISIDYLPDDKDNLFESVNNPDLEYAFPP